MAAQYAEALAALARLATGGRLSGRNNGSQQGWAQKPVGQKPAMHRSALSRTLGEPRRRGELAWLALTSDTR